MRIIRINLLLRPHVGHFFRVTGWMIVVLAPGLAAQAARFLEQADLLPPLVPELRDISSPLSAASLPGQLLHILVGYIPTASATQLAFYLATLARLMLASRWRSPAARRPPLRPVR